PDETPLGSADYYARIADAQRAAFLDREQHGDPRFVDAPLSAYADPELARLRRDDLAAAREAADRLGWPVIVKPTADGSSVGVSKVDGPEAVEAAFRDAAAHGEVMVEQFIKGGEYTVAILGEDSLPTIRIEASAEHAFYDYQAKYEAEDTGYRIPCGLSADEEASMAETAQAAFRLIGARGWGRVDFMRDAEGGHWLIEVNTVPGMTSHSLVPMAARAVGVEFPSLCRAILEQTLVTPSGSRAGGETADGAD
ncbi:MAG TPA: ATP-grasp domain-containing protein, partial [Halothiobacillaceae bacterium]|nr:ATP-grasp domain-containing protein [Halothiobacillaceae bacterium]